MLASYLAATAKLLQNPAAPTPLYSAADLTIYVNTARGQLAGDSEAIRDESTLTLTANTRSYPYSAIVTAAATSIVQGVLNVRTAWVAIGVGGRIELNPRPFEWFSLYNLNNPVPLTGIPLEWSQFKQGVAGSIYVDPLPDVGYTLLLDAVCRPVDLVDDSTPEAIPYPWTDAVPFFAAYYALLSSQNATRQADADRMMARYSEFTSRARRTSNASVLPMTYEQSGDPTESNKLGLGSPTQQPGQG